MNGFAEVLTIRKDFIGIYLISTDVPSGRLYFQSINCEPAGTAGEIGNAENKPLYTRK